MASIQVMLGGRKYPLIVEDGTEEYTKSLIQKLNAELTELTSQYGRDSQDTLAMLLIQKTLESTESTDSTSLDTSPCEESLLEIHQKIHDLL